MSIALNPSQNQILDAFPIAVKDRLFPHLEEISLPLGTVLYEPDVRLSHCYFPTGGIISIFCVTSCGTSAEISVVGNEGMVGIPLLIGGGSTSSRSVVQVGGNGYRVIGQRFVEEFNQSGVLMALVLRYTQALITQVAQTAVCCRHHTVDQQLCRCLLLYLDRLPSNHLIMTHESIAKLLGVRREAVTKSAQRLQRKGIIDYRRGNITVLNRAAVEELSCECYAIIKKETDRLLASDAHGEI